MHQNFWQKLARPILGLAPMDGITDAAFRQMVLRHGQNGATTAADQQPDSANPRLPSVVFTEFTTVEGLAHGAAKPLLPLHYQPQERPIIAQIFGTDPQAFYQACFIIAALGFDGIDINMGCPSKSVATHGAGAGLIRTPELAQEIVRACRRATMDIAAGRSAAEAGVHPDIVNWLEQRSPRPPRPPHPPRSLRPPRSPDSTNTASNPPQQRSPLPVSVKTRLGYDRIITAEWIQHLLEAEPDCLTLHGRTLSQMYSGRANWDEIGKAAALIRRERPETTFLGNGDIESLNDARQKTADYGLDGVLVGRATFGNPWFFSGHLPTARERLAAAAEHARLYESIFGGGPKAFAPMKKHLGWYCKGFPGAKELRLELMAANSATEVEQIIAGRQNGNLFEAFAKN